MLRALARGYVNNKQASPCDSGRCEMSRGTPVPFLNSAGVLVDTPRVMTHPDFPQIAGQGIYEYPHNPDETSNFIYAPRTKMDSAVQRTIDSNVMIATPQKDEDVVISEIWVADGGASTLAEMARVFDDFWKKQLATGSTIGWEPLDITSDRYNIEIIAVRIGGADSKYREIQVTPGLSTGAYLPTQLTLQFKIAKGFVPPKGTITLEGV